MWQGPLGTEKGAQLERGLGLRGKGKPSACTAQRAKAHQCLSLLICYNSNENTCVSQGCLVHSCCLGYS